MTGEVVPLRRAPAGRATVQRVAAGAGGEAREVRLVQEMPAPPEQTSAAPPQRGLRFRLIAAVRAWLRRGVREPEAPPLEAFLADAGARCRDNVVALQPKRGER